MNRVYFAHLNKFIKIGDLCKVKRKKGDKWVFVLQFLKNKIKGISEDGELIKIPNNSILISINNSYITINKE